jgi:Putative Flp pilus-assembly TadE/G-like
MNLLKQERGQVMALTAVAMTVLVGIAALAIDVGSWWLADRAAQGAADAAALAGAQGLPERGDAVALATQYWSKNPSDATITDDPSFPEPGEPSDTLTVKVTRQVDGFFAKVFGFHPVTVAATAQARRYAPLEMKNVAPIAVYKGMACIVTDPSCFGQPVTLAFDENAEFDPTKSKFGLLDLDRDGNVGAGDMKEWLTCDEKDGEDMTDCGYADYLPINTDYPPANGEKNGIKQELQDAADEERVLLFPVFDSANAATGYHIIGWAAFVIDTLDKWTGHEHVMTGHFVTFIATDLGGGGPNTSCPDPDPTNCDFGLDVIPLTK